MRNQARCRPTCNPTVVLSGQAPPPVPVAGFHANVESGELARGRCQLTGRSLASRWRAATERGHRCPRLGWLVAAVAAERIRRQPASSARNWVLGRPAGASPVRTTTGDASGAPPLPPPARRVERGRRTNATVLKNRGSVCRFCARCDALSSASSPGERKSSRHWQSWQCPQRHLVPESAQLCATDPQNIGPANRGGSSTHGFEEGFIAV